jgi:hypothetical protein
VRAWELPGPGLPQNLLGALQQAIQVFAGLAQASPQMRELTGQPLQKGTPLPPVLQELPHPPQQRPTVGAGRQIADSSRLLVREHGTNIQRKAGWLQPAERPRDTVAQCDFYAQETEPRPEVPVRYALTCAYLLLY